MREEIPGSEAEPQNGTTSLVELRRAQIEWYRAALAADVEYRRRTGEAWAAYQRALDEISRECSRECLDASQSAITGPGSLDKAAASRESQRRTQEALRVAAQRRRAAAHRYEEEGQRASLDAADALEAANATYRGVVEHFVLTASNETIDSGSDEGAYVAGESFAGPAWGYRWR